MMVDRPAGASNSSMVDQSRGNVKKLSTTQDFNKSMGISDLIQ